jgi:hypothetical protein
VGKKILIEFWALDGILCGESRIFSGSRYLSPVYPESDFELSERTSSWIGLQASQQETQSEMSNKKLYVGNLSYSTTEEGLLSAFAPFEAATAIIIQGRGFGFVEVPGEHMDNAVEAMNGKQLDGRTLVVNEARPREDRPRGGGGGGGYGGGGGGSYGGGGGGRSGGGSYGGGGGGYGGGGGGRGGGDRGRGGRSGGGGRGRY